MPKPIVVVGSINFDLVASTHRIPIAGQTVAGLAFRTFPGGKGANQAVAASRLGGMVHMLGKLGADSFGQELRHSLEAANVRTEAVTFASGPSGVALITTDAEGQNAITVVAGANGEVTPADLDSNATLLRSAGVLLTQLEIPLDTVEHLAAIAAREKIPLILDPAPARPLPPQLLQCVEWITPNETETCTLMGQPAGDLDRQAAEDAATALLGMGARNVILKLGQRGCYLALADGTRQLLPAYAVKPVDTTAAGDAFNGAFAVGLMNGQRPLEAASFASAVAAISVTRHGAQTSMPSAAEVDTFLDEMESVRSVH